MERKLKVGDSFEVVEVLQNSFSSGVFKTGGHTVSFDDYHQLLNGHLDSYSNTYMGQRTLCLGLNETKPIGKLTITKVK
ncbi:MAG TPA: hypothetical protein VNR38_00905 [Ureibacillus sp.]|nr:hypothetical protein [Ureibacillus sp.]